jgi:hypothetical protein
VNGTDAAAPVAAAPDLATGGSPDPGSGPGDVRALLAGAGIAARRLRTVVRLLTEGSHTLPSLVAASAVDRRSVEALLTALGGDLVRDGDTMRIAPASTDAYRDLVDYPQLLATEPADPFARQLAAQADLLARVRRWIATAPGARQALDHVSATPETVVRRALWLDATFDLAGARLLCVGDHDLTSLAVAALNPRAAVTVVDVDDAILEHIDTASGGRVRCLWADFRFGLAPGASGWGDLVLTDPPYTPDGVRLFLTRGLEGLRDREHARLVMAYGYGENHPALGLAVQQAVTGLQLTYQAVLPAFNRYDGAQAVGSASDLYVLRPTARAFRALDRGADRRGAGRAPVNIYTHGAQALEGDGGTLDDGVVTAVRAAAAGPAGLPVGFVGPGWPGRDVSPLAALFGGEPPAELTRCDGALALDLSGDPGGWLARALLAAGARRLALLVPNGHQDLASEAAQRALASLVAPRYRLRLRRSTPGPKLAIVEAERVDADGLAAGPRAVRDVLDRAHGKLGNTWREALVRASAAAGAPLTKNEARARAQDAAGRPEVLGEQVLALPRHIVGGVLADVAASARATTPG